MASSLLNKVSNEVLSKSLCYGSEDVSLRTMLTKHNVLIVLLNGIWEVFELGTQGWELLSDLSCENAHFSLTQRLMSHNYGKTLKKL